MAISGTEPTPIGPDPRINHRSSLSPPPNRTQTSRATSSTQGSTRSSLTVVHNLFDKLKPTATIKRYERSVKLEGPFIDLDLPPLTTSFDGEKPLDWTPLTHPEGALYWVYEPHGESVMPIYTDACLYDKGVLEEIERFREAILGGVHDNADRMPAKWELVLDLDDDEGPDERVCYYYFVNCSNRSLFWLHKFDVTPILSGLTEVNSMRRIQQALESNYWGHWEMFPHDREIPEKLLKELMGIMIHSGLDDMTSHGSTSVYSGDELQKFIRFVEGVKYVGGTDGYSACVVGRLMRFFAQGRYINFFGQREARLSTDQSIFRDKNKIKRTWLIKSMSFLLFFAPEVHLKALHSVYTDLIVCQHKWAKFITKVQNEWRELGRIGTVLLTANVAFLAIPSVDNSTGGRAAGVDTGPSYVRTPAQVTSFMSIIFSLGCLAIGQLLLRHNMVRPQDSAEEVDKYLRSYHDSHRGLETLAILYSLPYSLLLWAIASFFVAFVFVALVNSDGKWQRYPTAAATGVFVALLIWCIWTTWEGRVDFVERSSQTSNEGAVPPLKPRPKQANSSEHTPLGSVDVQEP